MLFQETSSRWVVVVVLLLIMGVTCTQVACDPRAGTVLGTAIFVDEVRETTLREAPNVSIEIECKGRKETLVTNENGDFFRKLPTGTWCLRAVHDVDGSKLDFAAKQHRCFKVGSEKDTRFDIMLSKP